ncbi:PRP38 family-domain-containing protein [Zychaea mexicana]|uniref:PRP38 family-domain-containing protein n=1 Tax=Zychaea mexicana TaxID=64656 RepID=UPI0022FE8692|nr:PRP38 family-domain-containing protein [Zychaea mexicana]KAI9470443.1 PRP38 family-domain-containing protein [Zychaea mexicana]
MANRTVSDARAVHGVDPQRLVEKIIRERIYDSMYWKEHCFGLTAATLMDKAVDLTYIGGQYAGQHPTEFLCLTLKMLQLQPEKDIVNELIKQEDFKYLRALGAFYLRLVGRSKEIYLSLEPLLNDPRKLRIREGDGFSLTYMDEFIDQLLHEDRVCDVILPRLVSRYALEENDELEPRVSGLEGDLESDMEETEVETRDRSSSRSRSRSSSRSSRSRSRSRVRDGDGDRGRSRARDRRYRSRSRSSSRGRSSRYRSRSRSESRSSSERRSRHGHRRRHRSRSYSRSRSRSRSNERRRR